MVMLPNTPWSHCQARSRHPGGVQPHGCPAPSRAGADADDGDAAAGHPGADGADGAEHRLEHITRAALEKSGGSEVKTMGDGFLASFPSAPRALECAIAMQRTFAEAPTFGADSDGGVTVRIGLNAGEPIVEDDELYGAAVIAAERIAGLAEGGEVQISNVVRELVAGKGFLLTDRGESAINGLEDPVRPFELCWAR